MRKSIVLIIFCIFLPVQLAQAQTIDPYLEEPVCGDDENEFLTEEMGESRNSEQRTGQYGCTPDKSLCLYRGAGAEEKYYSQGEYINANEPGEDTGRLKEDTEVCFDTSDTTFGIWWDQDYGDIDGDGSQETCKTNSYFGNRGVRWFSKSQVEQHPYSVRGGIDDDWNPYIENEYDDGVINKKYEVSPKENQYSTTLTDKTPVGKGQEPEEVATVGFCGGDDLSEYLIFQDSETRLVDTDQEILGVASSPSNCVLDNSQLNNIKESEFPKENYDSSSYQSERMLYDEGDFLEFEEANADRTIGCFDGKWWSGWPVVFYEEVEEFDLGETGYIPFMVINPTDQSVELDLELNPRGPSSQDISQITSFESKGGDKMSITVPAQSSITQRLQVSANRKIDTLPEGNDHEIEIIGQSTDGQLKGSDRIDMVISENEEVTGSSSNIRDIPGLTFVQMILIALVSTMMFIFRN